MYVNDLLNEQTTMDLSDREKEELKQLYETQEIFEVRITDYDRNKDFFIVEYETLKRVPFFIPFDQFNRVGHIDRDFTSYIDKYIGQYTYVVLECILEETVGICNRSIALDALEQKFFDTHQIGDLVEAEVQNIVFKEKNEVGLYVNCQGAKGFLPKSLIPLGERQLSQLHLMIKDKMKAKIININVDKRLFILSMKELPENLELKKNYLGVLLYVNKNSHVFDVKGNKVYVSNRSVYRNLAVGEKVPIYLLRTQKVQNKTIYLGSLS